MKNNFINYGQSDIVFHYEDNGYSSEKIIIIEYWNSNDIELILE